MDPLSQLEMSRSSVAQRTLLWLCDWLLPYASLGHQGDEMLTCKQIASAWSGLPALAVLDLQLS